MDISTLTYRPPGGGISGVFIYFWSQNGVPEVREVVKKLPRGRRIHSVRVSAQTEPWRPDSCTGKIVNYDPVSRTFKLAIYGPRKFQDPSRKMRLDELVW